MNDKMVLGQYYNGNSVIHKLDSRTKIFALIIMMIAVFMIPLNNFILLGITIVFILTVILLTKVPIIKYLLSLRQIAFLMIFTFAFQIFARKEGTILLQLDLNFTIVNIIIATIVLILFIIFRKYIPFKMIVFILLFIGSIYMFQYPILGNTIWKPTLSIYDSGLISGSFIVIRVFIIIMLSTTLTLTTKPMDLANGLEWYLKPFELIKIKTSILAMMISIALRFIPTLFNETDKILKAQASRGVDFKEGKLHEQIMQIISLLIPMFVISFKRAIDLADAMEARGYIPGAKRTRLVKLSFKIKDLISALLVIGLLVFVIIMKGCI